MTLRSFLEKAETYFTSLMSEQRHSPGDIAAKGALFSLARVYRSLVQLRISLYQQRLLRYRTLGCLVVSVGNVTCGGTGKTPVVEVFSRALAKKGRRVRAVQPAGRPDAVRGAARTATTSRRPSHAQSSAHEASY